MDTVVTVDKVTRSNQAAYWSRAIVMAFPRLERLKYSLLNAQLVVDKINNVEAHPLNKSNMQVIFSNLLKPETLIDLMFYNITAICIAKAKKGLKSIHYLGMRQESYY